MPGSRDGRRAVWAALAVTVLVVLAIGPSQAASPDLTSEERAFLAAHPVIRLGIDSEFAPLEFVDEQGHYSGMVADYVALIGKRLGVRFEPQMGLNFRESYARGLRQEIDVFGSVGRTPDREQHFLFTTPYVDITSVIVMRNDHEGVVTADDLPEYRVALVEGYAESYHLLQRLPQLRVLFEQSSQSALEAVSRGEADATIGSLPVLLYTMQKRALTNLKVVGANPTHSLKLHFMVRKDWPELQSILEKSLGAITPDEHRKIQEGWYSIRYEPGLNRREVLTKVGGVGLIALILLLALARWAVVSAREVRLRREAEEQARATAGRLAESRALVEEANQRLHETTETIAGAVFQIRVRVGGGALDLEFLSGRLANSLGLSPVSGNVVDFAALLKRVSEEDREGFQASIADSLRRGDTWQHEFRMEQPDGRVRWVRGESVPRRTPGGDFLASGYLSDVTERHAMEEALKRSETQLARALSRTSGQLQAILDNSPAAIWAKTLQGKYQFANDAFRRMFTIRREFVAGSIDEDFFPPRMVEAFRANDRTVLKTRAAASFVEPLEREGSEQHILSVKFPLFDERGETVAIGGMSLDITEQVQLQEELRSLNRNLALREQQLLQISRSSAVDRGHLEDTFKLVTSAACAGLLARRASVWFWNDVHDALECRHLYDVELGSNLKLEVLARKDYPRYFDALDGGRSIVAHDVLAHPATLELLTGYLTPLGVTSMLDTPIRHGGQVVGVLCCEHVGPARRWRDEESFFAGALADAIGRAIVAGRERQADQALRVLNATLEERVEQRTAELREAMETLQTAQTSLALKEAEAREAQAKLADITDSLPGAVYQFVRTGPRDYRFLFVSSGTLELTGVPRERLLKPGRSFGDLILPEDRKNLATAIEAATAPRGFTCAFRLTHAVTKEVRWMYTQTTAKVLDDGAMIFNGSITDLTEQKALEGELAKAREAAEAANRAKGDFLANMSHEIRTPMNAVIGLSHLALKMDLGNRQRDYLTKIHSAGQSLLGLINDILDLSKIEAGKLLVERIDFDLDAVLDNLATVVGQKANEKGLELLIDRPDVSETLVGDPMRLGQVLINLANNAVKFTERGEVEVKITLTPEGEDAMRLRAVVRDTGIGMTTEQQSRLFRPFEQADASTTRRHGGTGLGLAISRQLVSLMHGQIWVDSEADVGSQFGFEVVLGRSTSPVKARKVTPANLEGLRVLVVDDNPTSREILVRYVASFGFEVAAVDGGRAALQALTAASEPFDLVLLDWKMADMDGLACANAIRALPDQDEPPKLVMVSAYAREELLAQIDAFRFDGFLLKPVNPSLLFDAILGAFGQSLPVGLITPDLREAEAGRGLAGLSVLVVEDNAVNQQIAYEILEGVGVRVTIANHGREALDWMDRARFDAVLMDMQMPVMDGLEATRALRADPRFVDLPIVAMTANAMQQDREQCLAAGMNDHIAKPIDVPDLFRSLAHWTGRESVPLRSVARVAAPPELVGIDGFDVHKGLLRFGNDIQRYRRLVRRFVDSESGATGALKTALNRNDWPTAQRQMHSLKGLAATIGAMHLSEAAAELEDVLRAGRVEDALMKRLDAELTRIIDPLEEWLGNGYTQVVATARGDINRLLDTLRRQLADDDTAAAETLDELGDAMAGHPQEIRLAVVRRALGDYDFEAAQAALVPLAAALNN